MGVMIESNLVAGRQDVLPGVTLTYGQSITDGCIDWEHDRAGAEPAWPTRLRRDGTQRAQVPGTFGLARQRPIVAAGARFRAARRPVGLLAAAADALDLAVEGGVFLVRRIVRIAQILLRSARRRRAADGGRPARAGCRRFVAPRAGPGPRLRERHDPPIRTRTASAMMIFFILLLPRSENGPANPVATIMASEDRDARRRNSRRHDSAFPLRGSRSPGKRICRRQIIRADRRLAVAAGNVEHVIRLA